YPARMRGTDRSRARSRTARGAAAASQAANHVVEVVEVLERRPAVAQVGGEAARGEDAICRNCRAAVRIPVAHVDHLAVVGQVRALARLSAGPAGRVLTEVDDPAVGPRVDAVRPQLDEVESAFALEHRL